MIILFYQLTYQRTMEISSLWFMQAAKMRGFTTYHTLKHLQVCSYLCLNLTLESER